MQLRVFAIAGKDDRYLSCQLKGTVPPASLGGYIWGYFSSSKIYLTCNQFIALECESLTAPRNIFISTKSRKSL